MKQVFSLLLVVGVFVGTSCAPSQQKVNNGIESTADSAKHVIDSAVSHVDSAANRMVDSLKK